jgi:sRNA-binding protein
MPETKEGDPVALIEYETELECTNGKTDHTSAALPSLTKGQRLKVRIDGEAVDAEVIEVTKLTSDEPVKWKLIARELPPQP